MYSDGRERICIKKRMDDKGREEGGRAFAVVIAKNKRDTRGEEQEISISNEVNRGVSILERIDPNYEFVVLGFYFSSCRS